MSNENNLDYIASLGPAFLAHRLSRTSDLIIEATAPFLRRNGLDVPARSASTLLLLRGNGPLSITEIAHQLKLTHPLIIKLVARLGESGVVRQRSDPGDARRRLIELTPVGKAQADRLAQLVDVIGATMEEMFSDAGANLYLALEQFQAAALERSIEKRLNENLQRMSGDPSGEEERPKFLTVAGEYSPATSTDQH